MNTMSTMNTMNSMTQLGAHEVMELHEVLNDAIHGLNTMHLYRPYARDPQLQTMMDNHIQQCMMEYNNLVQMAQQFGASQAMSSGGQKMMQRMNQTRRMGQSGMTTSMGSLNQMNTMNQTSSMSTMNQAGQTSPSSQANPSYQPTYGLHNPQTQAPAESSDQIDDADVTLCIVNCHKQSAALKMKAALEMANPQLRQMVQTGANKSADMAYQGFQYANQRGYYQVPTLKDTTMNTYMQSYGTTQMTNSQPTSTRYM